MKKYNDGGMFGNMRQNMADRRFNRKVNKAQKLIESGAIIPSEDYVNPMTDMDSITKRAYLNTLEGEDYVKAMMLNKPSGNPFEEFKKKGGAMRNTLLNNIRFK